MKRVSKKDVKEGEIVFMRLWQKSEDEVVGVVSSIDDERINFKKLLWVSPARDWEYDILCEVGYPSDDWHWVTTAEFFLLTEEEAMVYVL